MCCRSALRFGLVRSSLFSSSLMGCGSSAAPSSYLDWTAERVDNLFHRLQGPDNTAPRAELQLGGVIKLEGEGGFFNPAPLLDHGWMQGRMSPQEWHDLIVSINACLLPLLPGTRWYAARPAIQALYCVPLPRTNQAIDAHLATIKPCCHERGINIEYAHARLDAGGFRVSMLFFVPTPLAHLSAYGSAPPEYADATKGAAAVPPGGAATGGIFVDVVKPTHLGAGTIAQSQAGAQDGAGSSSSAVAIPASAFRFCPLCAAPVQPQTIGKRFCPDCGGAWR